MGSRFINVPKVNPRTRAALVGRLGRYDRLVEVGVGRRPGVAAALARDAEVTATDLEEREVPPAVRFVVDDVTAPDPSVYAGAGAVYAINLPPELHRPARAVAREAGADLAFTTLGGDAPAVPARPETVPGDTLFWAEGGARRRGRDTRHA